MKKKKNILLYVVDSLNYSHIKNSDLNLMPFLEELKKNAVYCENMYSQAPYTEAALMNLYCGQDVLENGGYMLRFKDTPNTIFDAMRQNGYITFCNFYEPQCYPSSLRRGIDYLYYSVGYDQAALWSYRLKHFSELFSQGRLDEKDYELLYEILDDNLMEWIKFTDCLLTDDESIKMIQGNSSDYNTRKIKRAVEREYGEFIKDKNEYVENILKQGTGHSFFHIPAYIQNNKVKNRRTMEKVRKEFTPLFKRIRRMDFILNIHNCRGIWKGPVRKCGDFIKHPSAAGVREFVKSSYLAVNELIDIDLYKRIDGDYDSFKNAPSARKSIEFYINWAAQYKNAGPHFACIHVNDAHNPETFFTYDSDDLKLLEFEKREVGSILNQIPKDYSGSLTHELSLRYIDNTIKYMYEELERIGILKDTCVIITADHGFSFSGNPLRDSFVTNLYLENYNIPCVITGTGYGAGRIDCLRMSKDIPATICTLAGGEIPDAFSGHNIMEDFEYDYNIIEYCGGGCPDLSRRELKMAVYDRELFVGVLCRMDEELTDGCITEIYDLREDPLQLKNLVKKGYDQKKVKKMLKVIDNRRRSIIATNPRK